MPTGARLNWRIAVQRVAIALFAVTALMPGAVRGQDATWVGGIPAGPINSDYNTAANWTPATVPSGIATFGASANSNISVLGAVDVNSWTFAPGASAYTFTINGFPGSGFVDLRSGITVNGGSVNIINNFVLQTFGNFPKVGDAASHRRQRRQYQHRQSRYTYDLRHNHLGRRQFHQFQHRLILLWRKRRPEQLGQHQHYQQRRPH